MHKQTKKINSRKIKKDGEKYEMHCEFNETFINFAPRHKKSKRNEVNILK